jgi:hypothetical protein
MFADDRLTRLRALVAELERLPASPRAEWMLAQARARLVDVETGERTQALRPLDEDSPDDLSGPPAREAAGSSRRRAPKSPKPPRETPVPPIASAEALESDEREAPKETAAPVAPSEFDAAGFGVEGVLSLEDAPAHDPSADDGQPRPRPWRRGLRG